MQTTRFSWTRTLALLAALAVLSGTAARAASSLDEGLEKLKAGKFELALQDLDAALELEPKNAAAYQARGKAKSKLGDKAGALQDYDRAIEFDVNNAELYSERCVVKLALNDLDGAFRDSNELVLRRPDAFLGYAWRAKCLLRKSASHPNAAAAKAYGLASVRDYNTAIQIAPKVVGLYMDRGFAKREAGELRSAVTDFAEAIKLDPQNKEAYLERGMLQVRLQNAAGSLADFDQVLKLDPNSSLAYRWRGRAKMNCGNHQEALLDLEQALQLNPKDQWALFLRGDVKVTLGDYVDALQDYTDLLKAAPNSNLAYEARARVQQRLGNYQAAIEDYESAAKLGSARSGCYLILLLTTCSEEAVRDLAKAQQAAEKYLSKAAPADAAHAKACIRALEGDYFGAVELAESVLPKGGYTDDGNFSSGIPARVRIESWKKKKLWRLPELAIKA